MTATYDDITTLLATYGIEPTELAGNATLHDVGVDSLTVAELGFKIQLQFGGPGTAEQVTRTSTLSDLCTAAGAPIPASVPGGRS